MDRDQQAVEKFNISKSANTLGTVLAAAYAWQLHGILLGVVTLVFLWAVRRWTANVIALRYIKRTAETDEEPNTSKLLRLTMASRWAWVIVTYAALALSAAQVCTGDQCKSIWN
jgi:amino acid permease